MIFHAGTKIIDGQVQTSGGRVLAVTSMAEEHKIALLNSYTTLSKLSFEGINYRKDIGFDL
jgi:phosphoribosylamine--glycine ligase